MVENWISLVNYGFFGVNYGKSVGFILCVLLRCLPSSLLFTKAPPHCSNGHLNALLPVIKKKFTKSKPGGV